MVDAAVEVHYWTDFKSLEYGMFLTRRTNADGAGLYLVSVYHAAAYNVGWIQDKSFQICTLQDIALETVFFKYWMHRDDMPAKYQILRRTLRAQFAVTLWPAAENYQIYTQFVLIA